MKIDRLDRSDLNEFCNFGRFVGLQKLSWLTSTYSNWSIRGTLHHLWKKTDWWYTKCSYLIQTSPGFLCPCQLKFLSVGNRGGWAVALSEHQFKVSHVLAKHSLDELHSKSPTRVLILLKMYGLFHIC